VTALLIPTADEADWLRARRCGVTASEIAVVMGLSPWSSPYALYHRKAGTLPEQEDSDAMALGRYLERFVCDQFSRRYPHLRVHGGSRDLWQHPDRPWQLATPDRLLDDCPAEWENGVPCTCTGTPLAVLEAKTSSSYDGWGEDGSDEIPVHYRCQVLWQMDVLGVTAGYLACLFLHSRQLRVYELTRDSQAEHDLELMLNEAGDFLYRIRMGYPPDVDWRPATADALKRLHPDVSDEDVRIPRALAARYRAACRSYKAAEQRKRLAENQIRQRLGSGRRAVIAGLDGDVTVATRQVYDLAAKTIERSACTVDKLAPAKVKDPS
jgi:putative phage-type endonuclease